MGQAGELLSHNMFAYCQDNPVNAKDSTGFVTEVLTEAGSDVMETAPGGAGIGEAILSFLEWAFGVSNEVSEIGSTNAAQLTSASGQLADKKGNSSSPNPQKPPKNGIDKVVEKINKITNKYENLECKECAKDIKNMLIKQGLHGEEINIRFPRDFIWSNTANGVISENGFHTGILYDGLVYDNIHKMGMPLIQWITDFDGVGGMSIERIGF